MDSSEGPRRPLLIILSGPSGSGKDTVIAALRARFHDLSYAVTATTRPPRPGEIDGKSYFFVTRQEYDAMLDAGELLAPAEVHGHWYGAPLREVRSAFERGEDVLLKIDVQGAIQVRRRFPQAVYVFLAPPSMAHLTERMRRRHTESPDELARRTEDARFEMAQLPHYDYCVVNREDDVDQAVSNIACIVTAERLRTQRQPLVI